MQKSNLADARFEWFDQEKNISCLFEDLKAIFFDLFTVDHGISWEDIYYYQQVMDIGLSGRDITILRILSSQLLEWYRKDQKDSKPKSKPKQPVKAHRGRR